MKRDTYYTIRELNELRENRCRERYIERAAVVKKQKQSIFVILVVFFALLFFVSGIKAQPGVSDNRVKQYKSIMVYGGDTLEMIAIDNITPEYSSYKALVNEIRSINHLHSDNITAGNKIIVPYYVDVLQAEDI